MKKVLFMLISLLATVSSFPVEQKDTLKLVNLQEVQVVSTRAKEKTPLSYSDVNKSTIEKENFGMDVPFLLTITPSLVATSDAGTGIGYTGFRIRGTDANRINVTSNGIPMNDAESHGVFWVNIPDFASSLQDLQVQRGVGTSTNGSGAFGASINMKTENIPSTPYAEFDGSLGSFNTSKGTLKLGSGQIADHWAFDVRLSSINSDGYIDRASTDLKSYFAQTAYYKDNTLLKFITFGGKEKTYHAWDGVPGDSLKTNRTYNSCGLMGYDASGKEIYYDNQTDNYLQTNYQLSLLQVFNPFLNLNMALHYTKGDGYYEEYKSEATLVEYALLPFEYEGNTVVESDLVRQKHLDNNFGGMIFSLNYDKAKWDVSLGGGANYYECDHFGRVTWVKNYAGDSNFFPEHEYYRSKGKKTDANIYLKANYQILSNLNFYADMQYRYIDYKINGQNDKYDDKYTFAMQQLDVHDIFNFFNPKAGVFYRINTNNDIFASFAVGHREPNRNNYTNVELNESTYPKAEVLYDYEVGYKFRSKIFSAGINLYYMQYKDQLVLTGKVNEIGEPLTSNVPDSYRMGAEVSLGVKINSWLQWNGNITLSENKIKDYTEYVYDEALDDQVGNFMKKTDISYSPKVTANSLFSLNYKFWSAGLQSIFVDEQYLDNSSSNDRKLDSYFVNNLRLGYTFHIKGIKSLSLNVLVNNIFNESYESNGYVWYTQYSGTGSDRVRENDLRYFPQAGTSVIGNVVLKF